MSKNIYDLICVGSGPTSLGCVFTLLKKKPKSKILILEESTISSGGLRNDCKMNFTYPVGFPEDYWTKECADQYLKRTREFFESHGAVIKNKGNIDRYIKKAERLGASLLDIEQSHYGTDGGIKLIGDLTQELESKGVEFHFKEKFGWHYKNKSGKSICVNSLNEDSTVNIYDTKNLLIAPGRHGFPTVEEVLRSNNIQCRDNFIDIGVRIETAHDNYKIVDDYYDPKFIFSKYKTRTFCTNSGNARVVQEKYQNDDVTFYTVNGHAYSSDTSPNGMVNFAILKSVKFTEPLASGYKFAEQMANMFMLAGNGHPIYQRVEDIRLGKRSSVENEKNFDFEPTLKSAIPGDLTLCMPSKFFDSIWRTLKDLDTIVPGVLNPNTIIYGPEIKFYSKAPVYENPKSFELQPNVFGAGDGFGTSRGITAAFASGMRVADSL